MPRAPLAPDDPSLPYPVIRHPRFYSTRYFVSWYRLFLLRAARQKRFDVVHCHDVYPTGYVASLCREKLRIPLLITSHGGDARPGNVRLKKPGMRPRFLQSVERSDALISIGQFTTHAFEQLGARPEQIRMIPNGVDLAPFEHQLERPAGLDDAIVPGNYLLFLGRLSHRKGIDILLRAISKLPVTGKVEAVIAGSGDLQFQLAEQIKALGLQQRVRLVGRVAGEMKTYLLQNAMAIVVPSREWEAFPLVVLEAYAAGRPVVGSKIPGLEDVVFDHQTGWLVTAESADELAGRLQFVRNNSQAVSQAGITAKQRVTDFGWDRIADRHLQLYQELIKKCARIGETRAHG